MAFVSIEQLRPGVPSSKINGDGTVHVEEREVPPCLKWPERRAEQSMVELCMSEDKESAS